MSLRVLIGIRCSCRPVALNDLTLIRDGSIKHWVAVIDLVKTLGEGLADDNGSGGRSVRFSALVTHRAKNSCIEDFGEAQPASQMQTYLPRWYKSEASIEVDDATNEDMPMIKDPVEQTPNVDLRKALRYELLESPIARREQFRTVKQLWQSVSNMYKSRISSKAPPLIACFMVCLFTWRLRHSGET